MLDKFSGYYLHGMGHAVSHSAVGRWGLTAEPSLAVTPSAVGDVRFVRVAIGQTRTTAADVERLWRVIDAAS